MSKTYHGKPCKHCGGTERYTAGRGCVPCGATKGRKHREANRERYAAYSQAFNFKKNFGLTVAAYDAMLRGQGGCCAICKSGCTSGKKLSVDHCHTTGKIRGLLCGNCNRGLGMFKDSPALLLDAIAYLQNIPNRG